MHEHKPVNNRRRISLLSNSCSVPLYIRLQIHFFSFYFVLKDSIEDLCNISLPRLRIDRTHHYVLVVVSSVTELQCRAQQSLNFSAERSKLASFRQAVRASQPGTTSSQHLGQTLRHPSGGFIWTICNVILSGDLLTSIHPSRSKLCVRRSAFFWMNWEYCSIDQRRLRSRPNFSYYRRGCCLCLPLAVVTLFFYQSNVVVNVHRNLEFDRLCDLWEMSRSFFASRTGLCNIATTAFALWHVV